MKNFNSFNITIAPIKIQDNIVKFRKLWIYLWGRNKSLRINGLDSRESLILINRASAMKGLPPIGLTVQFFLSIGCSANCIMCDPGKRPSSGKSYDRILRLLDYIDGPTVSCIDLAEGEPLLDRNGLIKIMRKCLRKGMAFSISTNASCLTAEYIDLLVKNGLKKIAISIDSDCAQEHDRIRGVEGIFNSALKSIKYLKEKHPHVRVAMNSVIMSVNVKSLPQIIELANQLKVDTINFNYVLNKGKNFEQLKLKEEDLANIEKVRSSQVVSSSQVVINWDPCAPLQKTGCLYRYHHFIIEETGEIIFCNRYDMKEKIFLNKSLKQLCLDKEFQNYFRSNSFSCVWEEEEKAQHKFPFVIAGADRCEYKMMDKWEI